MRKNAFRVLCTARKLLIRRLV